MSGLLLTVDLLEQDLDDIEKIEEAVDVSELAGRDVAIAAGVFVGACVVAWLLGLLAKWALRRFTAVPDYVDQLAGRFVTSTMVFVGFAAALERLGVDVGWFAVIIALVGVVFVLMIRPLVENGASGLLLTTRPSFSIGDHVESNGYRGEVISINGRSTVIKTRDHRRVHIPNNDVLDGPIVVYTAYEQRRSQLEIEIAYESDVERTCKLLTEEIGQVAGVVVEPAPTVRLCGFGAGTVMLQLHWWHAADLGADGATLDRVAMRVKRVLDDEGVAMPSPELIIRQPELGR